MRERKLTLMFINKISECDGNEVNDKTEVHLSCADSVVHSESRPEGTILFSRVDLKKLQPRMKEIYKIKTKILTRTTKKNLV